MEPQTQRTEQTRGSSKAYLAIQLLIVPVATFFAVVFNESTLERYKAIDPGYPHIVTFGYFTPPEHLHFLHMIGPTGIIGFSIYTTALILVFSFVGRPRVANAINFVLLLLSVLFFLAVFVSYIIGLLGLTPVRPARNAQALPEVADISEMKASYFDRSIAKQLKFQVPKEHWDKIFEAMLPAQLDRDPAKWQVLGELEMTLKNGRPFVLMMFSVSEGTGAFASGNTFDQRVYYRGGDSTRLKTALRAAYDASEFKRLNE